MKNRLLSAGIVSSILGGLGIAACCFPFLTAALAGLGVSFLFLYRVSQLFLYIGILLIVLSVGTYFWKKHGKK